MPSKPRSAPTRSSSPPAPEPAGGALWRWLAWGLGSAVWIMLAAAMISHDPADSPSHFIVAPHQHQPANWMGAFGAVVSYRLYVVLGPGAWLALAAAGAWLVARARGAAVRQPVLRAIGVLLMALATSALLALLTPLHLVGPIAPEGAGGWLAIAVNRELVARFAVPGAAVVLIASFWVGALLAVDDLLFAAPALFAAVARRVAGWRLPRPAFAGRSAGLEAPAPGRATAQAPGRARRRSTRDDDEPVGVPDDADALDELDDQEDIDDRDAADADADDEEAGDDSDEAAPAPVAAARASRRSRAAQPARARASRRDDQPDELDVDADDIGDEADASTARAGEVQAAGDQPDDLDDDDALDDDIPDAIDPAGAYVDEKEFDPDRLRQKMKSIPINFAPKLKTAPPPREPDFSGYQFPSLDLLEEPESNISAEIESLVREQADSLEAALEQYRLDGKVVGIDSGPVITLFEVRLAPGTKVSRVQSVSSDLARALKAQNIRIVPNMVGKDTVGIEVPNLCKEKVRMKELMGAYADTTSRMKLPMYLGKDASGNPLIQDLAAMPHMLIAGTTGSGKSVCMNSIIMSFLYTKRPDELKLILVDPKMVEMSMFRDIPHLMCPVVTEMGKAAAILEWAVTKMDERYELLVEAGVRDIASYNNLSWEDLKERFQPASEDEEHRIPKKLHYMVFVIDELADLMMTNKEVEGFIVRIAQKARAVGIHLILATQRPQANVVTGLIKGNMPCRVSFKVASRLDSRIVLDQSGAELLLGHGDMLFLSPRTSKLIRAQGCLVDDIEIRKTAKFLKEISEPSFEPQLVQIKGSGEVGEGGLAEDRDELFEDAVEIVLETQRGSVSLLQRRLTVGYSRASRLIEQMSDAGIIGAYKGSQAREVMISLEEWEAMKAQAAADERDRAGTLFEGAEAETDSDVDADEAEDGDAFEDFDDALPDEDDDAFDEDDEDDDGVPDEMPDEYRR